MQLDETEKNFDSFWSQHEQKLHECLQLRQFEEEFKGLQYLMERHLDLLSIMTDPGDTLTRVETLIRELNEFEGDTKVRSSLALDHHE